MFKSQVTEKDKKPKHIWQAGSIKSGTSLWLPGEPSLLNGSKGKETKRVTGATHFFGSVQRGHLTPCSKSKSNLYPFSEKSDIHSLQLSSYISLVFVSKRGRNKRETHLIGPRFFYYEPIGLFGKIWDFASVVLVNEPHGSWQKMCIHRSYESVGHEPSGQMFEWLRIGGT